MSTTAKPGRTIVCAFGHYTAWRNGSDRVSVRVWSEYDPDGFTAQELRQIADHMDAQRGSVPLPEIPDALS